MHEGDHMINIMRLNDTNAVKYRMLRLNGLIHAKEAFGSSFEEEAPLPLAFFEKRLKDEQNITLGAFLEDDLVGILTMRRSEHDKTKHNGHLAAMYVDQKYQHQGIEKKLLLQMIEEAKSIGIINIFLTVTFNNDHAIHLYKSVGFQTYGIEKRELLIDGTYYDSTLMALYI
jgi:ribosomal protein S18 acetylase RimI-like enzyme